MRYLLYTDLDGTLLDHDDYSHAQALPALERLIALAIPVVMVTSKTRAEVEVLQREMGLEEPFVVENGGGVFFPARYSELSIRGCTTTSPYRLVTLGVAYSQVRKFIEDRQDRFAIEGFGDMGVDRLAEVTGLNRDQARLAKQREFTEPFLLPEPGQMPVLSQEAAEQGLSVTTGGRFHHLIGEQQDKGRAIDVVTEIFRTHWGEALRTIGLGDSPNDLPMLARVDYPIVIPRASGQPLEPAAGRALLASKPGSRGWNEAVLKLLERLYSDDLPGSNPNSRGKRAG